MRGRVLFYDKKRRRGIIEDAYNHQYNFHVGEWLSNEPIKEGKEVKFTLPKEEAISIEINQERNFFEKLKRVFYR